MNGTIVQFGLTSAVHATFHLVNGGASFAGPFGASRQWPEGGCETSSDGQSVEAHRPAFDR